MRHVAKCFCNKCQKINLTSNLISKPAPKHLKFGVKVLEPVGVRTKNDLSDPNNLNDCPKGGDMYM